MKGDLDPELVGCEIFVSSLSWARICRVLSKILADLCALLANPVANKQGEDWSDCGILLPENRDM
eukprot:13854590-Ditylum_brightwellii.AAC.1